MPDSRDVSTVELAIGGLVQSRWASYDIDSNLITPADGWHVSMEVGRELIPEGVVAGASTTLKVDGELVLTGVCDDVVDDVQVGKRTLELSGRDLAGVLLDCSAPIVTATQQTLEQIIVKFVRPLGITKIRIEAETQLLRERVSTEPGDSAWSALQRAAEANGLWPWMDPDGTLVVGGPDYTTEPVAKLVMRFDGTDGNLIGLKRKRGAAERYSDVTVLGQAHSGMQSGVGRHNVKAVVQDSGAVGYRPKILCDHEAQTTEIALARGRKFISDSRLKALDIEAKVRGHRVGASPQPLWQPGQRVRIVSEPHAIDDIFFVIGRKFGLSVKDGQHTRLQLKEDGVWTLDAHPHKRMHRVGRNSVPGQVINLPGAAS